MGGLGFFFVGFRRFRASGISEARRFIGRFVRGFIEEV